MGYESDNRNLVKGKDAKAIKSRRSGLQNTGEGSEGRKVGGERVGGEGR